MEIRDLEYLAASVTAGNFARAAVAIGISTSTISRRVARLEDELGLALFERGHSGVRLTPGGRAVMQHVRCLLGELEALKCSSSVSGAGDVGEIRLGVRLPPIGTPLLALLSGWRARNPNVILTVAEMSDRDLVAEVEGRHLDVVLTASQALWPRVASGPLFRDRLMAVLPAAHPLGRRSMVRWAGDCRKIWGVGSRQPLNEEESRGFVHQGGDFGSSVSTAFRILAQDVFQASGVKDTQTPFFQRDGVAGSDAISSPSGQHTESTLQQAHQQGRLAFPAASLLAFLTAFLTALLQPLLLPLRRACREHGPDLQ